MRHSVRPVATRPVLIAITATLAVSALCQLAYHQIVRVPEVIANGARLGTSAQSDRSRRALDDPPQGNPLLNAALFKAALDVRECAEREMPKAKDPPPEATASEGEALEISEEERLALDRADVARERASADTLEKRLAEEKVDPWWATKTEQATTGAAAAIANVRFGDVTCRETLCRVRMTHRDPAKRDNDISQLLDSADLAGSEAFFPPAQGDASATVLYVSRKGQTLSLFNPAVPPFPPLPAFPTSQRPAEIQN